VVCFGPRAKGVDGAREVLALAQVRGPVGALADFAAVRNQVATRARFGFGAVRKAARAAAAHAVKVQDGGHCNGEREGPSDEERERKKEGRKERTLIGATRNTQESSDAKGLGDVLDRDSNYKDESGSALMRLLCWCRYRMGYA
jgi:hypothetical protein